MAGIQGILQILRYIHCESQQPFLDVSFLVRCERLTVTLHFDTEKMLDVAQRSYGEMPVQVSHQILVLLLIVTRNNDVVHVNPEVSVAFTAVPNIQTRIVGGLSESHLLQYTV